MSTPVVDYAGGGNWSGATPHRIDIQNLGWTHSLRRYQFLQFAAVSCRDGTGLNRYVENSLVPVRRKVYRQRHVPASSA